LSQTIDVSDACIAKSDQLNAADLLGCPVIVEICSVRSSTGQADKEKQPYEVVISGGLKPWRPCKTMLRLLSFLWGRDASRWVGHWVRLWDDEAVTFGKASTGGIRISGADIPEQVTVTLPTGRQKYTTFIIDPIQPQVPTLEAILSAAGMTGAELDAQRATAGKPPIVSLSDDERNQLAGYYRRNPSKLRKA